MKPTLWNFKILKLYPSTCYPKCKVHTNPIIWLYLFHWRLYLFYWNFKWLQVEFLLVSNCTFQFLFQFQVLTNVIRFLANGVNQLIWLVKKNKLFLKSILHVVDVNMHIFEFKLKNLNRIVRFDVPKPVGLGPRPCSTAHNP